MRVQLEADDGPKGRSASDGETARPRSKKQPLYWDSSTRMRPDDADVSSEGRADDATPAIVGGGRRDGNGDGGDERRDHREARARAETGQHRLPIERSWSEAGCADPTTDTNRAVPLPN